MTFWNSKNKNENSNASDEKEIASDEKEIYFICVCRIAFARAADLFVYLNLFFNKMMRLMLLMIRKSILILMRLMRLMLLMETSRKYRR